MALGRSARRRTTSDPVREAQEAIAAKVMRASVPPGPTLPWPAEAIGAATLDFATFRTLWKRLVSKRKARKYNLRRDDVWQQLCDGRLLLEGDDHDLGNDSEDAARRSAAPKRGRASDGET